MAQSNTGTTAQGQQPQNSNDPQNQQGNQNPAANQPAPLIAGKFKSIDDMGQAFDSGFHDLTEKIGQLTRLVEVVVDNRSQPGYVPVGQSGGGRYDGYNRQPAPQDEIDPQQFILNPGQVLRQREDNLRREMAQQVATVVQDVVGNMIAVTDFKSRHPELVQHEPLVQSFMRNTNPRDPLAKRLEDAGKQTTDYLARSGIGRQQQGGSAAPNGSTYIEAPNRNAAPPAANLGNQVPAQSSDEAELAAYINERNNDFAAKFGIQVPK